MAMGKAAARCGRTVTIGACIGALVAGCGAAAPRRTVSLGDHVLTSSRESVEMIELSQRLGLVGLGTGSQDGGSARLVASSDFGRSFTAIGPRIAAGTVNDDVFFLNRTDGWLAVFNVNTARETLYQTRDRGRRWQAFSLAGHSIGVGSADAVQFLTPSTGWLTVTQPTAPHEDLLITRDGGRNWHLVASAPQGRLPALGPVEFAPSGHTGWQGGGSALWRTSDQGRIWHRAAIHAPAGSWFGLPTQFGRTLLEPVATGARRGLRLYRSTDGGMTRWSLVSTLPGVSLTPGPGAPALPPVSVASPTVVWVAAGQGHRTIVYRTTDQGRRWTASKMSGTTAASTGMQLQALDATHAWLRSASGRIYATSNGGRTWRRIDAAALARG